MPRGWAEWIAFAVGAALMAAVLSRFVYPQ
jgi:hypothetical protein